MIAGLRYGTHGMRGVVATRSTPCLSRRGVLKTGAVCGAWLAAAGPAFGVDLADVIAASKASVVPVGTFDATGNPRFAFRGTGFVVGDGRLVATNFHVLPEAAEGSSLAQMAVALTRAGSTEGQARRARVVATDRLRDLALLEIEGAPLTPLSLAEPGAAREGQGIALMGFPIGGTLGFSVVTHRGIISSITKAALPAPTARRLDPRAVSRLREGNFEVLQLDATAFPGNSGGPVIDATTGRVLGIVNQVLVRGSRETALTNPTGITYAIPIFLLRELMQELAREKATPAASNPR